MGCLVMYLLFQHCSWCRDAHLRHPGLPSPRSDPLRRQVLLLGDDSGSCSYLSKMVLNLRGRWIFSRFQETKRLVTVKNRHNPRMNRNINPLPRYTYLGNHRKRSLSKKSCVTRLEQPASTFSLDFEYLRFGLASQGALLDSKLLQYQNAALVP